MSGSEDRDGGDRSRDASEIGLGEDERNGNEIFRETRDLIQERTIGSVKNKSSR